MWATRMSRVRTGSAALWTVRAAVVPQRLPAHRAAEGSCSDGRHAARRLDRPRAWPVARSGRVGSLSPSISAPTRVGSARRDWWLKEGSLLISLTYISSATRELSESEVGDLLVTARSHNFAAGLSGMLLYAEEHFIQTLEGDEEPLVALFDRIRVDPRHHKVVVALRDEIDERAFSGWSMGCRILTAEQTAAIPGFNDFLDPDSELYQDTEQLGRAGIFHRVFRDTLPPPL